MNVVAGRRGRSAAKNLAARGLNIAATRDGCARIGGDSQLGAVRNDVAVSVDHRFKGDDCSMNSTISKDRSRLRGTNGVRRRNENEVLNGNGVAVEAVAGRIDRSELQNRGRCLSGRCNRRPVRRVSGHEPVGNQWIVVHGGVLNHRGPVGDGSTSGTDVAATINRGRSCGRDTDVRGIRN